VLYFKNVRRGDTISGKFTIVNKGNRNFKIDYINCYSGCEVSLEKDVICINDSTVVNFKMGIGKGWINAISAIGVVGNVQDGIANFVVHAILNQ
jgi:hypothetical protein